MIPTKHNKVATSIRRSDGDRMSSLYKFRADTAERVLIASVIVNEDRELLAKLDRDDFWPGFVNVWFLDQLKMLAMTGGEFNHGSILAWFRDPEVAASWEQHTYHTTCSAWLLESAIYYEQHNGGYLLPTIKAQRLRRAMWWLAVGIDEKNATEDVDPINTLLWIADQAEKLAAKMS